MPKTSPRNIWSNVQEKVTSGQTHRVVINLSDWTGDLNALRNQFSSYPMRGLDEVLLVMPDGSIVKLI